MKCVLKIFLFALVFAGVAFAEAQDSDEPSVSKFRERFSLRFLCDYNFVAIWKTTTGFSATKTTSATSPPSGVTSGTPTPSFSAMGISGTSGAL